MDGKTSTKSHHYVAVQVNKVVEKQEIGTKINIRG